MHLKLCLTKRCPEPGWGYSSTGKNDIYNYCQSDKSWNMTELEECICKFYFESKTLYVHSSNQNMGTFNELKTKNNLFQYYPVRTGHHQ